MKITILCVGKMRDKAQLDLLQDYLKRMTWKVDFQVLPTSEPAKEQQNLLQALPSSGYIIGLDERGDNLTSQEFSKQFEKIQSSGSPQVTIVIGGADGLGDEVRQRCHTKISFGRLTWPHMLVRIFLLEQLYRAQQIIAGHPYHRD